MGTSTPAPSGASFRLASVVVTYNRRAQLEVSLARLLAEPVDHVVVVDNGSTDGTRAWLEGLADHRLHLVLEDRNLGGAGGFEAGLRTAVATFDPDWIMVMDDDGYPESGAIAAFRDTDLAGWDAVAAAVRLPDGRICEMNRPAVNPFWNRQAFLRTLFGAGRKGFHLADPTYETDEVSTVDTASFVGLFLSRAAIQRAGYPDGRLFIYGDDVLYTLGLSRSGGRIGFFPKIRFTHDCSTFEDGERQFRPIWKTYYHYRNLLFVYRTAAGWLFWPALFLILPKWALKGRYYGCARSAYYRHLWRAVRDGLTGMNHVVAPWSDPALHAEAPGDEQEQVRAE